MLPTIDTTTIKESLFPGHIGWTVLGSNQRLSLRRGISSTPARTSGWD